MPTFMQKIKLAIRGWNRRREEADKAFIAKNTWQAPADVGRASARPEPVEEDPFGAVAVIEETTENPFEMAAEVHDPAAERGELEALLSSATDVVRSLESALEAARRHEADIRTRLKG